MAAIYYVNCVFAWVNVALSIVGYVYTFHRTGEKWAFWPIFALAWIMFAISHTMALMGISTATTGPTVIRIIGYSLIVIAILVLIIRAGSKK